MFGKRFIALLLMVPVLFLFALALGASPAYAAYSIPVDTSVANFDAIPDSGIAPNYDIASQLAEDADIFASSKTVREVTVKDTAHFYKRTVKNEAKENIEQVCIRKGAGNYQTFNPPSGAKYLWQVRYKSVGEMVIDPSKKVDVIVRCLKVQFRNSDTYSEDSYFYDCGYGEIAANTGATYEATMAIYCVNAGTNTLTKASMLFAFADIDQPNEWLKITGGADKIYVPKTSNKLDKKPDADGWFHGTNDDTWGDPEKSKTVIYVMGKSGSALQFHWWGQGCGTALTTPAWRIRYAVDFNLNKGSGSTTPSPESIKTINVLFDRQFSVSNPTRVGYTFQGWEITNMDNRTPHHYGSSKTAASTTTLTSKATKYKNLRASKGTVHFKAKWEPIKYSIVYNLNQGSGSTTPAYGTNHPTSGTFDANVAIDNPTRVGYVFAGWDITSMGSHAQVPHYKGTSASNIKSFAYSTTSLSSEKSTVFKNLHYLSSGKITFKAKWTPITYAITYDLNKGSGSTTGAFGTNHPASGTFDANVVISAPTRVGYVFAGWNITGMGSNSQVPHYKGTSASSIGTVAYSTTSLSADKSTYFRNLHHLSSGSVTFTATWTPIQYKITYDLNKGSGSTTPAFGTNHPASGTFDAVVTIDNPTRVGYVFAGWTVSGMGSHAQVLHYKGTSASSLSSVAYSTTSLSNEKSTVFKNLHHLSSGSITFQATWTPITYAVTYDLNKGSGSTTPAFGTNHPTSGTFDAIVTINNPTRVGYVFAGWNITGMGSNSQVPHYKGASASSLTSFAYSTTSLSGEKSSRFKNLHHLSSGSVKFTAVWTPITYKITYDLNKGSGSTEPAHGTNHPTSGTFDATVTINNPTRVGYVFAGWSITDMSKHAEVPHYHGTAASSLTKVGYATTSLSKNKSTLFKNLHYLASGTVKFKATWTPIQYNITYDLNKGTGSTEPTYGSKHPTKGTFDANVGISKPSRVGYTFAGWNVTSMGNNSQVPHYHGTAADALTKIAYSTTSLSGTKSTLFKNLHHLSTGTVKFTAMWTPIKYKVTYDLNKGTGSTSPKYGTAHPGSLTFDVAATIDNPTRVGYIFAGWTIAEMGVNTEVPHYHGTAATSLTKVGYATTTLSKNKSTVFKNLHHLSTGTVKFTAVWTPIQYKITYDLNKGTGSTEPAFGSSHPDSATFDANFTVNKPSRVGYTFAGWNVTAMGNNSQVPHYHGASASALETVQYSKTSLSKVSSIIFKNLHHVQGATVKFTAVWTPIEYKITYDLNKGTGSTEPAFGNRHPDSAKFDVAFTVSHPTRTGYIFQGWDISGMGNNANVPHYHGNSADSLKSVSSSTTSLTQDKYTVFKNLQHENGKTVRFKAVWKPIEYKIIYHDDNGDTQDVISTQVVKFDTVSTIIDKPANFMRENWTFRNCWAEESGDFTNLKSGGALYGAGVYAAVPNGLNAYAPQAKVLNWTATNGMIYDLYAVWDPTVLLIADDGSDDPGNPDGNVKKVHDRITVTYDTMLPDWNTSLKEWACRSNTRSINNYTDPQFSSKGIEALSDWYVDDDSLPEVAGMDAKKYMGQPITEPHTLYIHNSVWYWYDSTAHSFVPHPNYIFYKDAGHSPDQVVTDTMSNVYPVVKDNAQWVWFGVNHRTMEKTTLYYQDIEERFTESAGIYPNDRNQESDKYDFNRDYRLTCNTVFYVDWSLRTYDGVRSGW